jgi:hypothetical protein
MNTNNFRLISVAFIMEKKMFTLLIALENQSSLKSILEIPQEYAFFFAIL